MSPSLRSPSARLARRLWRACGPVGAAAVIAALATGCAPSCKEMCNKLDRCDLLGGVTPAECSTQCTRELAATKDTDADGEAFKDYAAQRSCIGTSSCDEIAAGACRDDVLFPFGE